MFVKNKTWSHWEGGIFVFSVFNSLQKPKTIPEPKQLSLNQLKP